MALSGYGIGVCDAVSHRDGGGRTGDFTAALAEV
jgi:hypothetical protein